MAVKPQDLIDSSEALSIAKKITGSKKTAEKYLNLLARTGKLYAECQSSVQELDFGQIWPNPPKKSGDIRKFVSKPGAIPLLGPAFWMKYGSSAFFKKPWDWKRSIFVMLSQPSPLLTQDKSGKFFIPVHDRIVCYGTKFSKSQILSEIKCILHMRKKSEILSKPRNKRYEWSKNILILEEMIQSGEMEKRFGSPENWGVQAKIENWLSERLTEADSSPSEATVRRKVKPIMDLWITFRAYN